jgi:hypothetical protein
VSKKDEDMVGMLLTLNQIDKMSNLCLVFTSEIWKRLAKST